jgi:hypothetical protein
MEGRFVRFETIPLPLVSPLTIETGDLYVMPSLNTEQPEDGEETDQLEPNSIEGHIAQEAIWEVLKTSNGPQ